MLAALHTQWLRSAHVRNTCVRSYIVAAGRACIGSLRSAVAALQVWRLNVPVGLIAAAEQLGITPTRIKRRMRVGLGYAPDVPVGAPLLLRSCARARATRVVIASHCQRCTATC